ncbi:MULTISPECIES: thioredoxin-dependent thiol peroxidase [Cyanophyceae]|uniref:thioredoxin-dependent thiol peroxidase n=1 Tax=Cyanophyceae TaxID=3028117 RepID=UPI00016DC702|nr:MULTISPECIES: thioredoxin-dependent thiol peroxidase [Cyanophyceae]ACA99108.1 bacterioferritin comigratory protein [Picosynechococcus sp. PCC 7002]SMH34693.1 peroxiredoxin Q/BCP [Picosynechococcus sp. OG1]SMQ84673.1 peroxiredoxin Q/BCP [Synechococcus sp. 7002]
MTTLTIGQAAPDFALTNAQGEARTLADYSGKWLVFYFYPKDNTPGCTTEALDFTALVPEFTALNAVIVGVSPDSEKSHGRFIEKKELAIELLSDPDHQTAGVYGVWQLKKFMGKEYMGIVRSTFLIDPQGQVAAIWSKVKVKGHAQTVLETLQT